MRRPAPLALVLVLLAALTASACGREQDASESRPDRPQIGVRGEEPEAAQDLGFPTFATKNTTRIGGADPVANAAAAALAVYPSGDRSTRPPAVVLVDRSDWRAAVAASALMAEPIGAPILFADGDDELPPATARALDALQPTGAEAVDDAQVIRIGDVPRPEGLRSTDVTGDTPAAIARAVGGLLASAQDGVPEQVLVVTSDDEAFAAPAAAWAAKSGDPILFVGRDAVPAETRAALSALRQPKIYLLGPSRVISPAVRRQLSRLGTVRRMGGPDPVTNAIEFARYRDGSFGWGVVAPGHGLTFVRSGRALDAAAAAPLSSSGKFGPIVLLDRAARLPRALEQYLFDLTPGFDEDPVAAVYNHGWIIGDEEAVSAEVQARIDSLLEVQPVEIPDEPPPDEEEEPETSTAPDDPDDDEPDTLTAPPPPTVPPDPAQTQTTPPTQTETTP